MGFEGANVIFDTWVHPLMMGLEEHLLGMFREDFEFNDQTPSHLGHKPENAAPVERQADLPESTPAPEQDLDVAVIERPQADAQPAIKNDTQTDAGAPVWAAEAEKELKKIPFFVRGKARRNTEAFAATQGLTTITLDTLYDAKAHFAR
jgi:light-independent protochlorophyllide reductase subunit B